MTVVRCRPLDQEKSQPQAYIENLLSEQPSATPNEYELTLRVHWMAWNAVILQETKYGTTDYARMMDQMLIGEYRSSKSEKGEMRFFAEDERVYTP